MFGLAERAAGVHSDICVEALANGGDGRECSADFERETRKNQLLTRQLGDVRGNPLRFILAADDPDAAAELRCSGLAHWNWQHRSRGNLRPLRIARASCNSSAGYYLLGRTRDMTALLQMWVGRQRTRGQEFPVSSPAIGQKNFGDIAGKPCKHLGTANASGLFFRWGKSAWRRYRLGEDHDKLSTDQSSGGLACGRSHDGHGSKWSAHWRISTGTVEPEFLRPLPLRASSLCLLSSLLRLLSCLSHRRGLLGLLPH